ncbi:hypothetical protein [Gimesia chilikensis]|nr:hypothetical protein [Gimesia chilikensis]
MIVRAKTMLTELGETEPTALRNDLKQIPDFLIDSLQEIFPSTQTTSV